MRFPSELRATLLILAAAILLIVPTEASARPRHRHPTAGIAQASTCFFFCDTQSPVQSQAEAKRQAIEQAKQARQAALQQQVELRRQAAEARRSAHREMQSFSPEQTSLGSAANSERVAATIVGGRPAGCPYKFCGCGASLEIFGKIIPRLNKAANWLRDFPHVAQANAAPDMAAANSSHVFVLKRHVRDNVWLVKDYNTRGNVTRLRERRLTGFTVVDPRGTRFAAAAAAAY
jgi:hypothetical protein